MLREIRIVLARRAYRQRCSGCLQGDGPATADEEGESWAAGEWGGLTGRFADKPTHALS